MAKYRLCKNAFDFSADLERAAQVLGVQSAREAAVTLALTLHGKITLGHPVDTGRARASWNLAEGSIDMSVHPPVPKGTTVPPKQVSGAGISGRSVIYVTNSLPYIVPLEYGHSQQAPFGMVRKAIAEVMASVSLGRPA